MNLHLFLRLAPLVATAFCAGCALKPGDPSYSYCPQTFLPEPVQPHWLTPRNAGLPSARSSLNSGLWNRPPGPPRAFAFTPSPAYAGPWWMYQTTTGTQTTRLRANGAQWTDDHGRQYFQIPGGNLRDANGNVYRRGPDEVWRR